jgi:hypothetical protein
VSHRSFVVALIAGAAVLGPAVAAPAAEECAAPEAGSHACVKVAYQTASDGSLRNLRVTATLAERVKRCAGVRARAVTVRVDGHDAATARPGGSCRAGIARWRTVLSPGETNRWELAPGSRIVTSWAGTTATAGVTISGAPAKPERGRTIKGRAGTGGPAAGSG